MGNPQVEKKSSREFVGARRATSTRRREFQVENFSSVRDWVHFCVEFDLKICSCCRGRARISAGAPSEWNCSACEQSPPLSPLPIHPDLWRTLVTRQPTRSTCPVCQERIPLSDCWISEDARRLYCARHLRPIETRDRLRLVTAALDSIGCCRENPTDARGDRSGLPLDSAHARDQLAGHLRGDRCGTCPHNGKAIYQQGRLVEIDGDRRRCTTSPDALNCADIDH